MNKQRLKIGLDGRGAIWYRGTGIGTYTYQLAVNFTKLLQPSELRVFYPGEEYQGLRESCDNYSQELIAVTARNYWQNDYLPQAISQNQLDIYHVPQNGIGLPGVKCCKQVVTIHDLIPYIYPETVGKSYLKEFLQAMPGIIAESDGIITVSQQSKNDIINIFSCDPNKVRVIYEAAEPIYALQPQRNCKEILAKKYGIDSRQKFILYVGGFGPRKNLRGLLVAFAMASKELAEKPILICPGRIKPSGGHFGDLITALGLEGRVVFPGFVEVGDLPYFYGGAELFVYPSLYEGFGLPVLEAMACGCPVVCSNTSSLPEVAGNAGVMVNPTDTLAIAEGIFQVLNNQELAEMLRRQGLLQADKFSWQQNAAETLEFYYQL